MQQNVTDIYIAFDYPTRLKVAGHYVDYRILVAHTDGWNRGVWATVTKVVPSGDDLYWMVEYDNGAIDVVRIFDNPESFALTLATATARTAP